MFFRLYTHPACINTVTGMINAGSFYKPENRIIYDVILALHTQGAVDGLLVRAELERRNRLDEIGVDYLRQVIESVPSSANVEYYSRIVRDRHCRRLAFVAGQKLMGGANDLTRNSGEELAAARIDLDAAGAPAGKPGLEAVTVRAARNQMKAVQWLVTGHIPCGTLTILVGPPGAGKSLFIVWLIAAMQSNGQLPNLAPGLPVEVAQGYALLVTCEDDPSDTIGPRLAACGLGPATGPVYKGTRIVRADGTVVVSLFDLSLHLPAIEQFLVENDDVKLLLIDPVQTFLGGTEMNGNTEINVASGALADLARRRDVAVILVTHPNKKREQSALDSITGSRGFSGTVRAAWQVTPDKERKGRCILSGIKQSNGPKPDAMKYQSKNMPMQIEGTTQHVPVIEFEPDRIDVDPDELVKPNSEKPRADKCVAWFKERLAAGAVLSSTIFEEGAAEGFSRDVCYAAKDRLRVKPSKGGFQGRSF